MCSKSNNSSLLTAMWKSKRLIRLFLIGALAAPAGAFQAQSLAAHWTFSETSGTTLHDTSGNGFDATVQGGVILGQAGGFPSTGNCAHFDANLSGFAVVQDQPPLTGMLQDLSMAAWVRFETGGPSMGVNRIFGGNDSAWSGGVRSSGLRFTTRYVKDYDLGYNYPKDQWFHVVYVLDAAYDVYFYVDGVLAGQVVGSQPSQASSGEWLIGSLYNNNEFWHGDIDDLQVYEGSLTAAEVQYLFQNPGGTIFSGGGNAFCFGDGSGGMCPCGNSGAADEGCANSVGVGARLSSHGSVSITNDDLGLHGDQMVPGKLALLFAGRTALGGGSGFLFGDGFRCAGGGVVRLGTEVVDGSGTATWGPGLGVLGGWNAGDTRRFQVWYQDTAASSCGWAFNTSHALELTFNQ
jgi:hypothetical protein